VQEAASGTDDEGHEIGDFFGFPDSDDFFFGY
jgi:hypothetical protein